MLTYTMGGPSIDAGAPCGDPRILRYTPPVPEFEVMVARVAPGEEMTLPRLQVPAIFIVIEGAGTTLESGYQSPIILRPGRTYYMPPGCEALTLKVPAAQRGSLKLAIAHENLHLDVPINALVAPARKRGSEGDEPSTPSPKLGPTVFTGKLPPALDDPYA